MTPAEIGPSHDQSEFWNILLSRSCRNEKFVLLPSDYKSMFFKLSADIKFMPINLDLDLEPEPGSRISIMVTLRYICTIFIRTTILNASIKRIEL